MENQTNLEQPENKLVALLKEKSISEEIAISISPAFNEFFEQANEWNVKANEYLSDPNLSDEEKWKEARKARLALVKVRTGIDKVRKSLNEEDQQKITDRNSAAKIITALVVPTEEKLEEFEKRKEREEQAKKDAVKNERLEKIAPYNVDCTFFDLANMPEEAFSVLLENSRLAHEKKADDQRKIEEKEALDLRFTHRVGLLSNIGFRFRDTFFEHDFFASFDSDVIYKNDDDDFFAFYDGLNETFERNKKEEAAKKKAEEERLKAEKEAAERKALLLEQEQKEREEKHKTAVLRQQKLASINFNLEYEFCNSMTDQSFEDFFKEQNSIYQAEENRKFIEKKKAEREAAEKKQLGERTDKRIRELQNLSFGFQLRSNSWVNGDIVISVSKIESVSIEEWNQAISEIEARFKADCEAELAPEKTKLLNWINSNLLPALNSEYFSDEGKKICEDIFNRSQAFNKWANDQINTLK